MSTSPDAVVVERWRFKGGRTRAKGPEMEEESGECEEEQGNSSGEGWGYISCGAKTRAVTLASRVYVGRSAKAPLFSARALALVPCEPGR